MPDRKDGTESLAQNSLLFAIISIVSHKFSDENKMLLLDETEMEKKLNILLSVPNI
jgi:hypothetical protein